jgi:negative regulator of flagellin synthesis FlgM
MRIAGTGSNPVAATLATPLAETPAVNESAAAPAAPSVAAPLQSAAMEPSLAALRKMPDMDMEKVAQLRDALAKGELPFDPAKLAGLIQRFHGGRS